MMNKINPSEEAAFIRLFKKNFQKIEKLPKKTTQSPEDAERRRAQIAVSRRKVAEG